MSTNTSSASAPRQTPLTCSGHTRPVVDLAFSPLTPDGYFLVSACKDGKPMLRQGETGDWLGTFDGHKGAVWGATLDKPAMRVATGSADFTAKVWNALSGEETHSFAHPHIVKTVDFSPDGTRLLTSCNDKMLRVFTIDKPGDPVLFKGHESSIAAAIFSPDGTRVMSGGDDKVLRVWNAATGEQTSTVSLSGNVTDIVFSADGKYLTVTHGKTVTHLDGETLAVVHTYATSCPVFTSAIHPGNDMFVWGGEDNYIHVCDFATGAQREEYKGHFGPVHCIRFSPDGELYASGSEDGTVRLWQTTVGKSYGLWKY